MTSSLHMHKEIYEQPAVLSALLAKYLQDGSPAFLELKALPSPSHIVLLACGTSFYACMSLASLLVQKGIDARAYVASEYAKEKGRKLPPNTLAIGLSQSGETTDTLNAMRLAKSQGASLLAICNTKSCSMFKEANYQIDLQAGREIGIASTKAFCAQMLIASLLALHFSGEKDPSLNQLPQIVQTCINKHAQIRRLSKRYLSQRGFFFIGSGLFYPLALEGALKLKETSYQQAQAHPSGEIRHGLIALAEPALATIALLPKGDELSYAVASELAAKDSVLLAIASEEPSFADDFLKLENAQNPLQEYFGAMVYLQLLALEIAHKSGLDVDKPRNLVKAVI